ncbi:hypothetical protein [Brevundimonas sp. NIBR11]|uniref:hypothetical protein n=1 Tax=Brevundimonas sp. NIBR11 TaxID=3015999 RepID=UPI0022F01972|nr:hypothetical protein [Brevundimonas sp. NIBR11]
MSVMNAQAVPSDVDALFDALIEQLEHAVDLSSRPNRDERLGDIQACCIEAARLAGEAMASPV